MAFTLGGSTTTSGQGIDVSGTVDQYITAARAPERQWQAQQSALKAQASAITQLNNSISALNDAVSRLKDPAGTLSSRSASTSQPAVLTASAEPNADYGSHVVVVNKLVSTSTAYSDGISDANAKLTAGSFDLQVGSGAASTITISSEDTLTSLVTKINGQNLGVTAGIITDSNGAHLTLVAKQAGDAGDITITNQQNGIVMNKGAAGKNASLTVDGMEISSTTNTIDGVISGVSLNLIGSAPGTEITVTVGENTSGAVQAVRSFVNTYNTIIQSLNSQFAYNSSTQAAGVLAGDATSRIVQQQLLSAISYVVPDNGGVSALSDLGITMSNDGTLAVDDSKLNSTISSHYADVQTFFQSASATKVGFATSLGQQLGVLTDPTDGAFYVELQGNNSSQDSLQTQIDDFEVYIATKQQQLTEYYNRINVMLEQLPSIQAQLQAELPIVSSSNK